ncbi:MAG: hypothetical protein ABR968_14345 [Bacteroidales bacterium]|jgi:hypothetical protein
METTVPMIDKKIKSRLSLLITFVVLSITLIWVSGCRMNKILKECSVDKKAIKATKAHILSQIDSVYSTGNENSCKKYKRIVSQNCINNTAFDVKTRLIIKVKNKCDIWDDFYFGEDFTIIKVTHELKPIY